MLDKTKYRQVKYVSGQHEARMAVNDPRFRCMTVCSNDVYEVQSGYRRIKLEVNLPIACSILAGAKVELLKYVYQHLLYFVELSWVEVALMDTDSIYAALHGRTLRDSVKPDRLAEFDSMQLDHCSQRGRQRHPTTKMPRKCCDRDEFADNRTPNLWKQEYSCEQLIALTSKTYICYNSPTQIKVSCKGINKSRFCLQQDPLAVFTGVLETRSAAGAENTGFQLSKGSLYTYRGHKSAFPFVYFKRQLIDRAAVFTRAIPGLVLDPLPKLYLCLQRDAVQLDCDTIQAFTCEGYPVKTVRQAYTLMHYVYTTSREQTPKQADPELLSRILRTTDPYTLFSMRSEIGQSPMLALNMLDEMYFIVGKRMSRHTHLNDVLLNSGQKHIVNACHLDSVLGTGYGPGRCRWEEGAYLRGANLYGKALMKYRKRLTELCA